MDQLPVVRRGTGPRRPHLPHHLPRLRFLRGADAPPGPIGRAEPAAAHEPSPQPPTGTAFVLGGGSMLGASQLGMLRALSEHGIVPDRVYGTSIGALNGAVVARFPLPEAVRRLERAWTSRLFRRFRRGGGLDPVHGLFRVGSHFMRSDLLRAMIHVGTGGADTFSDLTLPFECCASNIEHATETWFTRGDLERAILASAAVPGMFPPVEIDGRHFLDGGLTNTIPISRAVAAGVERIYVLQVGRVEHELEVPRGPTQMMQTALQISRRHRFAQDMASLPDDIEVHVLPTGTTTDRQNSMAANWTDRQLRRRIDAAYRASTTYLDSEDDLLSTR